MGIQSTRDITREEAIERIRYVWRNLVANRFKTVEEDSHEDTHYNGFDVWEAKDKALKAYPYLASITDIGNWTDAMLEDAVGFPYLRYSMLDNYCILRR